MSKIGIFGGSFNPIHNGHIHLVDCAKNELALDKVILMPAGIAPHKACNEYVSAEHRYNMCVLAADDIDYIEVSDYEINKSGKSYTVHTIEYLRSIYPDDELYLLVGSDMLLTFDEWYNYEKILNNATLCAVSRSNYDLHLLEEKAGKLRKFGNIYISHIEGKPMSSSQIRRLIKNNKDLSCYLPKKVVQYIEMYSLYTDT